MSGPTIPSEAVEAAAEAGHGAMFEGDLPTGGIERELWRNVARAVMAAAAPHLIAAYLRKLADTPYEDGPWWALESALRREADELTGDQR